MKQANNTQPERQGSILEECFAAMDHLRTAYDLALDLDIEPQLAAQIRGVAAIMDAVAGEPGRRARA